MMVESISFDEYSNSLLCFLDSSAVAVYTSLTILSLVTPFLPLLKNLASHGKTRQHQQQQQKQQYQQQHQHQQLAQATFWNQRILVDLGSRLQLVNQHGCFLVPKRFFTHFYVVALISLYVRRQRQYSHQNNNDMVEIILWIHLIRRLYECVYVHQWRPQSHMHAAAYLVGIAHYVWLPFVFFPYDNNNRNGNGIHDSNGNSIDHSLQSGGDQSTSRKQLQSTVALFWMFFCLWAQYQQYRHHVILANLRRRTTNDTTTTTTTSQQPQKYQLPNKGWFQSLSCPHYTAEILLYIGLSALSYTTSTANSGQQQLQLQPLYTANLHGRLVILLAWVVSNLTVMALESHQWYLDHFPQQQLKTTTTATSTTTTTTIKENHHRQRRRWAIIPFVA